MNFGAHISISGGIEKSPERACKIGCECFQIFSRSPKGGKFSEVTKSVEKKFKENRLKCGLKNFYIHTPYYINLASANNRIYYGSISAVRKELEAADLLCANAVVTHLGSVNDLGKEEAYKKLIKGIEKIFQYTDSNASKKSKVKKTKIFPNVKLLLEITSGAGGIISSSFEEVAYIIKESEKRIPKNSLGVCFDTAHAFAAGYDLRCEEAVNKTFEKFDKVIGFDRLKLVHCNDSAAELNSHIDRHENIGDGNIGIDGFKAIIKNKSLWNLDFIIETPPQKEKKDLEILKSIRRKLVQDLT